MRRQNTKLVVTMGILVAVNIVLTRFLSLQVTDAVRISFGHIPVLLAGVLLGTIPGACVAIVGDFVGCALFSPFPWFPPIAITPVIVGAWAGIFRNQLLKGGFWRTTVILFAGMVPVTLLYNTYALTLLQGTGFWTLFIPRAPVGLLVAAVNATAVCYLLKSPLPKVLERGAEK